MKVNVWDNGPYDIACDNSGGPYNYMAIKEDVLDFILIEPVQIGNTVFEPGKEYTQIGNGKKTSSGFAQLKMKEGTIVYYGHFDGHILFTKTGEPMIMGDYIAVFYAWKFWRQHRALFYLNFTGSGRVIELD